MQISTKGRYGLRAVLELASQSGDKPTSTKEISQKQKITIPYLEQLFFKLKHKGLVKSVRGAQGGYFLARKASEITVGEIIDCLDGPIELAGCKIDNESNTSCIGPENCLAIEFWDDMKAKINDMLFNTSLQDLLDKAQNKTSNIGESIKTEA